MIHFHEVHKSVQGRQILFDLTLFLPKASYTLIKTENQSGQTLASMIMAYEKPDRGSLKVDGIDIGSIRRQRIPYLRRQIGLINESPALLEERTVSENISVPLQLTGFDRDVITQRLNAMLDKTGLRDEQNKKASDLTPSQRLVVTAARATIHKPGIVLANDPLLGRDGEADNIVIELLNNANATGSAVLLITQNHSLDINLPNTATTLSLEDGTIKNNEYEQDTVF